MIKTCIMLQRFLFQINAQQKDVFPVVQSSIRPTTHYRLQTHIHISGQIEIFCRGTEDSAVVSTASYSKHCIS